MFLTSSFRSFSFALASVLSLCAYSAGATEDSPAGVWKTFDDKTHQARGTIEIFENGGAFEGKIETSFNRAELTEVCDKCTGDRRNAPIIGLVVMRGMRKHGTEYDGGEILDPETGNVYKCKMTLSADGEKLMVRGYLGMSWLGRTQTWVRVSDLPIRASNQTR